MDVVVLHYWNTPSVWEFLSRVTGRVLRWVLYCHVNGVRRPQLLPAPLADALTHLVLTSPHLMSTRRDGSVTVVPALVDLDALPAPQPATGDVVHVGTLTVFKLDPGFVGLHDRAVAAGAAVRVVGAGSDEQRFAALSSPAWRWHGYDPQPWVRLAGRRVFSAPIRSTATSSGEKTIQEAGLLGIPTLVYADSPVAHLIEPGVTGLLTADREEFARMLVGSLPDRTGVAEAARARFHPDLKADVLARVYDSVAVQPARPMPDLGPLPQWVAMQTAGALVPGSAPPPLRELASSDDLLEAFQNLASEGGQAHFRSSLGPQAEG